MLEDNKLSTWRAPSRILGANNHPSPFRLRAFADGGEALMQEPRFGMYYQQWTCEVVNEDIQISAPNSPPIVWHSGLNIENVKLAFDFAMFPYVLFTQDDELKLLFFNRSTQQKEVLNLGEENEYPQIALDEPRQIFANRSDVILSYLREGKLYYRQQRDLFAIERKLHDGPFLMLKKTGINHGGRFQFEVSIPVNDYID